VTYDAAWIAVVQAGNPRWVRKLAQALSFWGDFPTGTLILVVAVALWGWLRQSPRLKQAALACLLAASVAGLSANVVRSAVGRPRPMAKLPDGAYGPTLEYRLLGFPSAHAATSFGTGAALVVTVPPLGVAALIGAGGVAWSRMVLNRHHPTDVAIGGSLGIVMGLVFGIAARRRSAALVNPAKAVSAEP